MGAAHRFLLTRRGGWLATTAASSANYSLLCAWPRLSLWRLPIPQPAICARRSSTRAFEKLLLSADSFVYSTPTRRYQQEEQEEQEQGKLRKTKRDAPRGRSVTALQTRPVIGKGAWGERVLHEIRVLTRIVVIDCGLRPKFGAAHRKAVLRV